MILDKVFNEFGIEVFNSPMFKNLRVAYNRALDPLFCLVDVCKALGISNSRNINQRLDKRGVHPVDTPTMNQHGAVVVQKMTYISESNLYKCIFQSRKPEAEAFKDWVVYEVLPAIRNNGMYLHENKLKQYKQNPERFAEYDLAAYKRYLIDKQEFEKREADLNQRIFVLEKEKEDSIFFTDNRSTVTVGDAAKVLMSFGINFGRNDLFTLLTEKGIFFREGKSYIPYQNQIKNGNFVVYMKNVMTKSGKRKSKPVIGVTVKGLRLLKAIYESLVAENKL